MSIKVTAVYRYVQQKQGPVPINELRSAFQIDSTPKAKKRLESVIAHLVGNKLCSRNGDQIFAASLGRSA